MRSSGVRYIWEISAACNVRLSAAFSPAGPENRRPSSFRTSRWQFGHAAEDVKHVSSKSAGFKSSGHRKRRVP